MKVPYFSLLFKYQVSIQQDFSSQRDEKKKQN